MSAYPIHVTLVYKKGNDPRSHVENIIINDVYGKYDFYGRYIDILNDPDVVSVKYLRHKQGKTVCVNFSTVLRTILRSHRESFFNPMEFVEEALKVLDNNEHKVIVEQG